MLLSPFHGLKQGLLLVWLFIFIDAIPWPFIFGGQGEVKDHEGRIPELDTFLREHAAMLANREDHAKLVPKAIEIAREYPVDPESAKYYIDLLMKIEKEGLNTLKSERKSINRQLAHVFSAKVTREESIHVMKQRHILDAFLDAAADVAWPWIRGTAKPIARDEL